MPAVGGGAAAVAGEGFGAGVQHDLAGDGRADDRRDDSGGTFVKRGRAAVDAVHVVEDVGAGADFSELR